MNIMRNGRQQIEMGIWFVEHATTNFLAIFALTFFVKSVMYLLMNTVTVILNHFFLEKMKCLLCGLNCSSENVIQKHYVHYHQITENDNTF